MSATFAAPRPAAVRSIGYAPSLTGMRWAAALLVFIYHVRNFGYFGGRSGEWVDRLFGNGNVGVSFFFVLSGFVLAYSAGEHDSAARFWCRRIARIYPLHLVTALAALALGAGWVQAPAPAGGRMITANLLLVSSWWSDGTQVLNPVSWSLTCEAFFYAIFPLLLVGVRRVRSLPALYGLLATCLAATLLVPSFAADLAPDRYLGFYPLARLPEFAVGVVLARLVRTGQWAGPGLRVSTLLALVGYVACRYATVDYQFAAYTVIGLTALIAAAANADQHGCPTPWSGRSLVRLGELSFAFYLVHILVMRTAQALPAAHPGAGIGLTLAVFAVSLGLACALNEFVEVPARALLLHAHFREWALTSRVGSCKCPLAPQVPTRGAGRGCRAGCRLR